MRRKELPAALCLALAASALGACGERDASARAPADAPSAATPGAREAPALATDGAWVKGGPLRLDALRGKKVVLLEIGFASCKRCRATVPHLARWRGKYAADDLEVVFVNDGTVAPPLEGVQGFVKDLAIEFPVLHDERGTTAKAYGVSAYPHVFLIDRSGHVVWDGSPVGREAEVEAQIVQALD